MKVLGLVPARGGSKGIPRKNIRLLGNRSVLEWTAEAAQKAVRLDRTVLSTDDIEIAEVGRRCGLDVPFMRPAGLAQDDTPTLPVITHALSVLADEGDTYDAVCLLQPTNPFRRARLVDNCIDLLQQTGADAVMTIAPVPADHHPDWAYFAESDGRLIRATGREPLPTRRQDLRPAFHREGSVYVTRTAVIASGSLYGQHVVGVPVDPSTSVNLDAADDFRRAEELLSRFGLQSEEP